jgi:hypothetical protein
VKWTARPNSDLDLVAFAEPAQLTTQLKQRTRGSVFDTITTETFKLLDCIFPTSEITAAFDKLVEPLLAQIRANLHQSRTLAGLRDSLLPKLLSGELSVPAALLARPSANDLLNESMPHFSGGGAIQFGSWTWDRTSRLTIACRREWIDASIWGHHRPLRTFQIGS